MCHIAEGTTARTQIAQYHEGGRAFAEALADVGAGSFFTHRVQIVFAQYPLHVVITLAAAGFNAYPFGFTQTFLQRNNFNRVARRFGCAGLL